MTTFGRRNVVWGWSVIGLGAASGLVLMAWSFAGPFAPPAGFTDYGDLARRMVRLAHIALFMLPIINILIGKDLDGAALSDRWKLTCSVAGLVAMIGIPLGLTLGALVDIRLKYVAMVPAYALLAALAVMAFGVVRAHRGAP
jgi:hypothetical protein